ncbi:MAG: tRNA guanosine(34) transglycosylase Tgt [Planctomycetes bacterium]|nr:tRNA guanosine(34) transglycosylase Tgt [Planctomycetota bacterium]
MISFRVTSTCGSARRGILTTPHGEVQTPVFMPVGTAGSVKGVTPTQLRGCGAQMILANTYHLQLRPGAEIVNELGGLHRFMGWNGPILTDSGGYQIFSLTGLTQITDEGVEFRSHIDGASIRLTPADAIHVQNLLGADIIMVLDECPPLPSPPDALHEAVRRTLLWAEKCKDAHHRKEQSLFAIVQGGLDATLRKECAESLVDMGFDGYAIGGLSVGESHEEMMSVLPRIIGSLPADRPRYLMGVGMPRDILAAVRCGVDMFDCVLPTRNGRNSYAFTAQGPLKMRNERHRNDSNPLESGCDCEACASFSRGYIRHLFNAEEMLAATLTSIHNIRFFQRFMARIRELIVDGNLGTIEAQFPIAGATMQTSEPGVESGCSD